MTHYSLLRLKNFPEVDGIKALSQDSKPIGPHIDVNDKSPKLNFASTEEVRTFYLFTKKIFCCNYIDFFFF